MPKAAKRSGLTQALGGMNPYLAIGYVLTAAVFLADLGLMRWIHPIPKEETLLVGQFIHAALVPASALLFIGARRSAVRLRKVIGYSLCAFTALLGIGACMGVALILNGRADLVAA